MSRPHICLPSTSRTSTLPSKSRATAAVSRSKNSGPSTAPTGAAPEGLPSGARRAAVVDLATPRVPPPLVDVERLVGVLVHRLPVHAGAPRGDADAELHGDRHLGRPVELVERFADTGADLVGVALVGVGHRD